MTPPLVPGLPLLGSALALSRDPLTFLCAWYARLGPIFRVRVLGREVTVLAGLEANRLLMRAGAALAKGGVYRGFDEELGPQAHFSTVDGDPHTELRRVVRPGYARRRLEPHLLPVLALIRAHLGRWTAGPVDLMRALELLALDLVGRLFTSVDAADVFDDTQRFVRWLHYVYPMRLLPRAALHLPVYQRAKRRVFALAAQILAVHAGPRHGCPRNLIDDLRASGLPQHKIAAQAIVPYFVGIDTLASTGAFLLYRLISAPDALARVRDEARHLLGGDLSLEALKERPALQAAVHETIRLHPIAPLVARRAIQPLTFEGYTLSAGTEVIIASGVTHTLAAYYPDPAAFRLDRPAAPPGVFSGWGLGAHTCLGAGLAEALLMLIAAVSLHEFDLRVVPERYRLRVRLAPIPSPAGLRVLAAPRLSAVRSIT